MGAYILRRILISIPVLIGITIIGFVALKLAPGDPLLVSVNPEVLANLLSNPELLEAERRRLGFDQPIFPNQYLTGSATCSRATWATPSLRSDRSPTRSAPVSRRRCC